MEKKKENIKIVQHKPIDHSRIHAQSRTITIVLLLAAVVIFAARFFLRSEESRNIMLVIGSAMLIGAVVVRLFTPEFGYKPTRKELEKQELGQPGER